MRPQHLAPHQRRHALSLDLRLKQVMSPAPFTGRSKQFGLSRIAAYLEQHQSRYGNCVSLYACRFDQIEIDFSVVQCKALTPNTFASLKTLRDRLFFFESHYGGIARPVKWKFTRTDPEELPTKVDVSDKAGYRRAA